MLLASCSVKGAPDAAQSDRCRKLLHDISRLLQQCPPVQAVVLPGGYFVRQGEPNRYLDLSFNVDDFATNGRLVKIGVGDDEVCVRLFDFGNG